MGKVFAFIVLEVMVWGLMFAISFLDAGLMLLFLSHVSVPFLANLSYGSLYWINMAIMMPVGSIVGIVVGIKPILDELFD